MERLLIGNEESSLVLLFTVLGSFGTLLGGFGSLLLLQKAPVRKALLASLLMVGMAEVFLVGWGINLRLAKAAALEKRSPKPRPGPAPAPPAPTPKELDPEPGITEDKAISNGVKFNLSSRSDPSIRREYCIDSNVSGTLYNYDRRLMVKLSGADFDLCKYSVADDRQVEYRIGVAPKKDIARSNWRAVFWSQPQKGRVTLGGSAQLIPEKSLVVPIRRPDKNKGAIDLTNYGVVLSVYNRARRGLYYLADANK